AACVFLDGDVPKELLPVRGGVLLKDGQEIDEGGDGCSGRSEVGLPKALSTVRHEGGDGFVRNQVLGGVTAGIDVAQLVEEHVEVLGRKARKPKNGTRIIHHAGLGEGVFRQAGLQGRVAVQATTRVHQELGGAS